MEVADIMNSKVQSCSPTDTTEAAARIMWEHDCGAVPVVDQDMRVLGMITDRDICMATYTKALPPQQIAIRDAMSKEVFSASPRDSVFAVERLMQKQQIRRVPVTTDGQLVGMISLADIARHIQTDVLENEDLAPAQIALTLGAISSPHGDQAPLAEA